MSSPNSQYDDAEIGDSLYAYAYRADNTNGDNTKLRRALELDLPVILLRRIKMGSDTRYIPISPVSVVADNESDQKFILALDQSLRSVADPQHLAPIEKMYAQRIQHQRLHQPEFRGRVLLAYRDRCAVCRLGHRKLLDAAHIISDGKSHGTAEVTNGLSLCKIHHAAYDKDLLGISPDYRIRLGVELKGDDDNSPTLLHAFQGIEGHMLTLPRQRAHHPCPDRLRERFTVFESKNVVPSRTATIDIARPLHPVEVSRSMVDRTGSRTVADADL